MIRYDKEFKFISIFDPKTGEYLRSDSFDENGMETGEDPFMSSFPELIDVGIMGSCKHGKSGLCMKADVECYQDGLHASSPNMSAENFERIAKECSGRTYQFALGGAGDPDQHEDFERILRICENNRIVPNFTTSGLGMTKEIASICKKYCGAVAVSWYRSVYTLKAIDMLLKAGVKTNIHYVVSNATIDEAVERLKCNDFPDGINAVVFLLHKPVGLGSKENVLQYNDPRVEEFFSLCEETNRLFKIGFDSCSIPGILNLTNGIDEYSIDTCEGARWSMYITADMIALPCSFDNQERRWGYDISKKCITDAWKSAQFENFRSHFKAACPACPERELCMGGCPICEEIVLCKKPCKKTCI